MTKIDFQPMPKRFMVWDRYEHRFHRQCSESGYSNVYTFFELEHLFNGAYDDREVMLIQSTNLFDKDDKEIFEGSIVDYDEWGGWRGVVVFSDGYFVLKDKEGNEAFLKGAPHQKLLGHILSNPELLEV